MIQRTRNAEREERAAPSGGAASRTRYFVALGGLLMLLACSAVWAFWRKPETTAAMRGRALARSLGCFACHGPDGTGGVPGAGSTGATMPGWDGAAAAMYVGSEGEIREWILDGRPRREHPVRAGAARAERIAMPAYADVLSDREVDDLAAFFLAVSGWAPGMPAAAYAGRAIAARLGCFGCHGPSGMGGVPNPRSFTGYIPPWDGGEFAELVRDDDELREWIMDGRIRRLWNNPAARFFLEGQVIRMPAYRDRVSDVELDRIVSYILWVRRK